MSSHPASKEDSMFSVEQMFQVLQTKHSIHVFGQMLDFLMILSGTRDTVQQTALWMHEHAHFQTRIQIKIRLRAMKSNDSQSKIYIFYLLHEYFKHLNTQSGLTSTQIRRIHRQWYQTVDEVIQACVREIKTTEQKRRIGKTLARWEEIGMFSDHLRDWKKLVNGDLKPNRLPPSLPVEVDDKMNLCFKLQPHRTENPYLQPYFSPNQILPVDQNLTKEQIIERRCHWRWTGCFFLRSLAESLELSTSIVSTALVLYHTLFERGFYARERFRIATSCLILASKGSNTRIKLFRIIRARYAILHKILLEQHEEHEEMEKLTLLEYEIEVLKGIDFEMTVLLPFEYLKEFLQKHTIAYKIAQTSFDVLFDLFCTPACRELSPIVLAEGSIYVACQKESQPFDLEKCCSIQQNVQPFSIVIGEYIYKHYQELTTWMTKQQSFLKETDLTMRQENLKRSINASDQEIECLFEENLKPNGESSQALSEEFTKGLNNSILQMDESENGSMKSYQSLQETRRVSKHENHSTASSLQVKKSSHGIRYRNNHLDSPQSIERIDMVSRSNRYETSSQSITSSRPSNKITETTRVTENVPFSVQSNNHSRSDTYASLYGSRGSKNTPKSSKSDSNTKSLYDYSIKPNEPTKSSKQTSEYGTKDKVASRRHRSRSRSFSPNRSQHHKRRRRSRSRSRPVSSSYYYRR